MWLIPASYGLLLLLRLLLPQQSWPGWAYWLAPVIHLGGAIASLFSRPSPWMEIAMAPTMGWFAFSWLVPVVLLIVADEERQDLRNAGLFVGGVLAGLWLLSLDAKLATPLSRWEIASLWLADAGSGFLVAAGMASWRLFAIGAKPQDPLLQGMSRIHIAALVCITSSLLAGFQHATTITLSQMGHLMLLMLAAGSLVLPPFQIRSDGPQTTPAVSDSIAVLSLPYLVWQCASAFFAMGWAFARLFALA